MAAFRQLLERWFDPCVDVAWQILHDVDAAAEVAQDTFATAWQAHLARKPTDDAGTLLMRATRDGALGRLAQQRHAEPGSEPWPSSGAPALRDQPGRDPGADLLRSVSAALGESDASVLDLHLRHGFTVEQVAQALGAPRNDTQELLMRLKRRLGRAVRAWALWRDGRPDASGCTDLRTALDGNDIRAFGPEAVTVIARHAKACERCQDRQRLEGTPESLMAAVPVVPAGTVVASRAAEVLRARGIPLDPPDQPADRPAPPADAGVSSTTHRGDVAAAALSVAAPRPARRLGDSRHAPWRAGRRRRCVPARSGSPSVGGCRRCRRAVAPWRDGVHGDGQPRGRPARGRVALGQRLLRPPPGPAGRPSGAPAPVPGHPLARRHVGLPCWPLRRRRRPRITPAR